MPALRFGRPAHHNPRNIRRSQLSVQRKLPRAGKGRAIAKTLGSRFDQGR